jgi:hypothetical protein
MSPGRIAVGRARAVRALLALTAVSACLGAVAYAATRPEHLATGLAGSKPVDVAPQTGAGTPRGDGEEQLPRPRFIEYPDAISVVADPQFRFHVPPRSQRQRPPLPESQDLPGRPAQADQPERQRRFQCRLDGGGWRACSSPFRLGDLRPGDHAFEVRALSRAGQPGPAISHSWRQAEPSPKQAPVDPKPFSIELGGELGDLYPGDPAQQVPVLITNPNSVPIEVTSVTVAIAGDLPDCPAENFALTGSSVSPTTPLTVPADGSVGLPTATVSAPAIGMLNLPVNQDVCRGTEIPLVFSGEAHG